MAQWTKRRMAGLVRNLLIGIILAVLILLFYFTGILDAWIGDLQFGLPMLFETKFYLYLGIMITIIGIIMLFIRSWINWGGA